MADSHAPLGARRRRLLKTGASPHPTPAPTVGGPDWRPEVCSGPMRRHVSYVPLPESPALRELLATPRGALTRNAERPSRFAVPSQAPEVSLKSGAGPSLPVAIHSLVRDTGRKSGS